MRKILISLIILITLISFTGTATAISEYVSVDTPTYVNSNLKINWHIHNEGNHVDIHIDTKKSNGQWEQNTWNKNNINNIGQYTWSSFQGVEGKIYRVRIGNKISSEFSVIYNTAPVVTLIGSTTLNMEVHSTYYEHGATAWDAQDGFLSYTITGVVNNAIVGVYTKTYTTIDSQGAIGIASRTINVVDTTAPIITPPADISVTVLDVPTSVCLGVAEATDNSEQPIGIINSASASCPMIYTLGVTTITWTATDQSGNYAIDTQTVSINLLDSDSDGVPDKDDVCPNSGIDVCEATDPDSDGVPNGVDNCPSNANPNQADIDGDGIGNACDLDDDADGILDNVDNCPLTVNPDQADLDNDGSGDACDVTDSRPDSDEDGVKDVNDNCPLVSNPNQADSDHDGKGNACDTEDNLDTDGDGVQNWKDNCPNTPENQESNSNGCSIEQLYPDTDPHGVSLKYSGNTVSYETTPEFTVGNVLSIIWNGMFDYVNIKLNTHVNEEETDVSTIANDVLSTEGNGQYDWTVTQPETSGLNSISVYSTICNEEGNCVTREAETGEFQIVKPVVVPEPEVHSNGGAVYVFGKSDVERYCFFKNQYTETQNQRALYNLNIILWENGFFETQATQYEQKYNIDCTTVTTDPTDRVEHN
jgi:hypothetical protein